MAAVRRMVGGSFEHEAISVCHAIQMNFQEGKALIFGILYE